MSIRKDFKIRQIIKEVSIETGVSEEIVYHILNNQFGCVAKAITNNQDIQLPGFGSFRIKYRRRMCLNIEKELEQEGKTEEEIYAVKKQTILGLKGAKQKQHEIRVIKIGKK